LTNGQWINRDTYANSNATTLNLLTAASTNNRLPLGLCFVTMRFRFAGLVDPTQSSSTLLVDKILLQRMNTVEEKKKPKRLDVISAPLSDSDEEP